MVEFCVSAVEIIDLEKVGQVLSNRTTTGFSQRTQFHGVKHFFRQRLHHGYLNPKEYQTKSKIMVERCKGLPIPEMSVSIFGPNTG